MPTYKNANTPEDKPKKKYTVTINGIEYRHITLTNNGKKLHFYGATLKEAKAKRDEYKANLKAGIKINNENLYAAMFLWLWEVHKHSVKESTFEREEIVLRCHIKNCSIANIPVNDIDSLQLQRYFNSLIGVKTVSQIKFIYKLVRKFFLYLHEEGFILRDPCKNISIPESDEIEDDSDMVISTNEEIKTIYNSEKEKIKYMTLLDLASGLREGELCALDIKDIVNMEINVTKTVRKVRIFDTPFKWHYEFRVTAPKTKRSRRKVPLPSSFKPILDEIFAYRSEMDKFIENPTTTLFPTIRGQYMDAKNLRVSYKRFLKRLNIPYRTFHNLRHTYATKLFENGANILTVSRLLGHASIEITIKTYIHVIKRMKVKEVDTLNDIFNPNITKTLEILKRA